LEAKTEESQVEQQQLKKLDLQRVLSKVNSKPFNSPRENNDASLT